MEPLRLTRAGFLRLAAAGAAACLAGPAACSEPAPPATPPSRSARMHTRPIPATGEALPVVGVGTWQGFDVAGDAGETANLAAVVEALFAAGGTVIDSSPMYGRAEAMVGKVLTDPARREAAFLATKVWTRGRDAGIAQMRESLRRFGVDRVDLMQVHNLLDLEAHLPTLRAMKDAGRIRYLGVTHYTEGAYDALEAAMRRHPLDFIQINASVAERGAEARILPLAAERGMAVLINRPFAGGDVFGRVRRLPLPPWAAEIGAVTWGQVLLKYVLANPAVTCAIPGTRNPRHVLDNLGAATGPLPDAAQRRRILDAVAAA